MASLYPAREAKDGLFSNHALDKLQVVFKLWKVGHIDTHLFENNKRQIIIKCQFYAILYLSHHHHVHSSGRHDRT